MRPLTFRRRNGRGKYSLEAANVAISRPAMTLPLAICPRIRLREDEPERTRAAWLPPKALPITAYWVVMGFLSYGVSQRPAWLTSEGIEPERAEIGPSPVRQITRTVAARSEAPAAKSEPPAVREETPAVRNEAPAAHDEAPIVRSKVDEAPMPTHVPPAPPMRSLFEPPPVFSTAATTPHDPERARDRHRSRRDGRLETDSVETARPSSLALHFDPVPQGSYTMRDVPGLTPFVPAPTEAPPAPARPVHYRASTLPGCESAVAAANTEWDLTAARGAPDLSRDAYAAVLEHGGYFSHCAVPAGTALDICAAVQKGRPLGITVIAHPTNPQVSACVKAAVESLRFPSHPRLDVTRTHFGTVSGR